MSTSSDDLFSFLKIIAHNAPLYLVWMVGCVACVERWRRHPQVSLLTLLALGLLLASAIGGIFLWVCLLSPRYGEAIWTGQFVVSAFSWVLLLLAMFRWR